MVEQNKVCLRIGPAHSILQAHITCKQKIREIVYLIFHIHQKSIVRNLYANSSVEWFFLLNFLLFMTSTRRKNGRNEYWILARIYFEKNWFHENYEWCIILNFESAKSQLIYDLQIPFASFSFEFVRFHLDFILRITEQRIYEGSLLFITNFLQSRLLELVKDSFEPFCKQ